MSARLLGLRHRIDGVPTFPEVVGKRIQQRDLVVEKPICAFGLPITVLAQSQPPSGMTAPGANNTTKPSTPVLRRHDAPEIVTTLLRSRVARIPAHPARTLWRAATAATARVGSPLRYSVVVVVDFFVVVVPYGVAVCLHAVGLAAARSHGVRRGGGYPCRRRRSYRFCVLLVTLPIPSVVFLRLWSRCSCRSPAPEPSSAFGSRSSYPSAPERRRSSERTPRGPQAKISS